MATRPPLLEREINPRLITTYLFSQGMMMKPGRRLEGRLVVDYEAEYILESSGAQVIDGREHRVRAGDVVFRRPGQSTQGIMPYRCFCAIFDMEGKVRPRPQAYVQLFSGMQEGMEPQPDFDSAFLAPIPPVFHPSSGYVYRSLFESILKRHISPGEGSELLQKAALLHLIHKMRSDAKDPLLSDTGAEPERTRARLGTAIAFLRLNYRRKLPLNELARVAGLSPGYFQRVFSQATRKSPLEYQNGLRLERARELLAMTDINVGDIAEEIGFENSPYFYTLFKRMEGESPMAFRERHRFIP
jgi:AraC-like DNA-binding protein